MMENKWSKFIVHWVISRRNRLSFLLSFAIRGKRAVWCVWRNFFYLCKSNISITRMPLMPYLLFDVSGDRRTANYFNVVAPIPLLSQISFYLITNICSTIIHEMWNATSSTARRLSLRCFAIFVFNFLFVFCFWLVTSHPIEWSCKAIKHTRHCCMSCKLDFCRIYVYVLPNRNYNKITIHRADFTRSILQMVLRSENRSLKSVEIDWNAGFRDAHIAPN